MILVINRSKKEAEALASSFRYMGIPARGELPERAASEVSTFYRAIILFSPEKLPDEKEFITRIRSYISEIPTFALTDDVGSLKASYAGVAPRASTAARLYKLINKYCESRKLLPPGEFLLGGINASVELGVISYFFEPLPFTKTERLIIRLLIRTYPSPLSPKTILKYAFKQSALPEAASIRTHVCAINRRCRERIGVNLIVSLDGGYVILTPGLARDNNIDFYSAAK